MIDYDEDEFVVEDLSFDMQIVPQTSLRFTQSSLFFQHVNQTRFRGDQQLEGRTEHPHRQGLLELEDDISQPHIMPDVGSVILGNEVE